MNPASLISNLKWVKKGTIIVDSDTFHRRSIRKKRLSSDPLMMILFQAILLIKAPMTSMTAEAGKRNILLIKKKSADRSRKHVCLGYDILPFQQRIRLYRFVFRKEI